AERTGGTVTSMDIEPCLAAKERVEQAGLVERWTFIQGDDLSLQAPRISDGIDFLFIDTNHLHKQTLAELETYSRYLVPRAWIALHDSVSFPGVASAVLDFMAKHQGKFSFYPYMHQNGLIILRFTGADRDALHALDQGMPDSTTERSGKDGRLAAPPNREFRDTQVE